eukprot:scaffold40586_cov38-Phaeocystis_antarctica.AAC.3
MLAGRLSALWPSLLRAMSRRAPGEGRSPSNSRWSILRPHPALAFAKRRQPRLQPRLHRRGRGGGGRGRGGGGGGGGAEELIAVPLLLLMLLPLLPMLALPCAALW